MWWGPPSRARADWLGGGRKVTMTRHVHKREEHTVKSEMDRRSFLARAGVGMAGAALLARGARAQDNANAGATPAAEKAKGEGAMVNVAMLSKWHPHAKGYGNTLANMEGVKIACVWDEDPQRGQEWAKELNAPFIKDLDAVMARQDVNAVCVNAPSNRHAEIMVAAAETNKHIFTEKVMALTVKECEKIAKAVKKADVKFCISFPYRTRPECLYAKQAVEDGLLGKLTSLRVRVAHDGVSGDWLPPHFYDPVTCGGGAMMDLGAHPMYLSRWIGGQPKHISSTFTYMTGHKIEDNAVSVIEFEGGALGVSETSFMSKDCPFYMELTGTEGTLFLGDTVDRRLKIKSQKLDKPDEWVSPKLPKGLPQALQIWYNGIVKGEPIAFDLEAGTQLTEMMQYAYLSAKKKKQVAVPARKQV